MAYKDPKDHAEWARRWRKTERGRLCLLWSNMKQRCSNPNNHAFPRYGGRGITVCERWAKSFSYFVEDMGPRPNGTSLERINNDGNYEPHNCMWATPSQQSNNKRNCRYVEIDGQKVTLKEACRRRGLPYKQVHARVHRMGWPIERAVSVPIGPTGVHHENS